jgi:hypothetical protein
MALTAFGVALTRVQRPDDLWLFGSALAESPAAPIRVQTDPAIAAQYRDMLRRAEQLAPPAFWLVPDIFAPILAAARPRGLTVDPLRSVLFAADDVDQCAADVASMAAEDLQASRWAEFLCVPQAPFADVRTVREATPALLDHWHGIVADAQAMAARDPPEPPADSGAPPPDASSDDEIDPDAETQSALDHPMDSFAEEASAAAAEHLLAEPVADPASDVMNA